MKTILITMLMLIGIIWIGCRKCGYDIDYTGEYQVTETIACYGPCDTCFSERNLIIDVACGKKRGTLNFMGRTVELDANGEYSEYDQYGYFFIRFNNAVLYSNYRRGGLECGRNIKYQSLKISK